MSDQNDFFDPYLSRERYRHRKELRYVPNQSPSPKDSQIHLMGVFP